MICAKIAERNLIASESWVNASRVVEREDEVKAKRLDGRNLLVGFVNKAKRTGGDQAMNLGSVEVATSTK
jgi:hypothetical protein